MVRGEKAVTWKGDVERALHEIGRAATVSEIYSIVQKNRVKEGRPITTHSRHGVRRILQDHFICAMQDEKGGGAGTLFWFPNATKAEGFG